MMRRLIGAGLVVTSVMLPGVAAAGALPEGFVYLRDVDPTIVQDIRYASAHARCRLSSLQQGMVALRTRR
jgi:D-alanyl-D-alanine dipeptidase